MKLPRWTKLCQKSLALAGATFLIASLWDLSEGWLFQSHPRLFMKLSSAAKMPQWQALNSSDTVPPLATLAAGNKSADGIRTVGRLEIRRLHISRLVVEGDGENALRLGVGHVPGSALGGPNGNTVLAGHRDTFFRCLRHIRIGDEVFLQVAGDLNRYRVTSMRIVSPGDGAVMKGSGGRQLTLITCYPFGFVGSAPKRLIVNATPVVDTASIAD
jgi:sortase A